MNKRAYTVKQFCDRNNVCRQTFYDLVRSRRLRAKKLGKRTIVTAEDEQAFHDSLPLLELK